MTSHGLQGMREMLRGSVARSLRTLSDTDRLAAAWVVACGTPMAEHGEVIGFEQEVLQVQVSDPAWLQQMMAMRRILEREIARIAGVQVSAIHFEMKKR